MTAEPPLVVQTLDIPSDHLQKAHERGDIRLRVWKPSGDHAHLTSAPREWVLENVPGASALLVLLQTRVDDELLDRAGPSLKVVSTMSVGFDHIDLEACAKHNVRVGYSTSLVLSSSACSHERRRGFHRDVGADGHAPCAAG